MMLHPSRKEGGTGGMTRLLSFQTTDLPPSTPGCVILATSFLSLRVFTVFILAPFFGGKTNTSEILSSEGFRLSWFLIPLAMVGTLRDVEKYIVFWKTHQKTQTNIIQASVVEYSSIMPKQLNVSVKNTEKWLYCPMFMVVFIFVDK